ncbi:MAG: hypothetical protein H7839_08125 [Magnetococcus sp. YQC-5]
MDSPSTYIPGWHVHNQYADGCLDLLLTQHEGKIMIAHSEKSKKIVQFDG